MKRIISLFLVCIFTASLLLSCATNNVPPEEAVVGKWKYSLNENIRDALTKVLSDERVYVDIFYEFYSDGTGCTYSSLDDENGKTDFSYKYDGEILTMTVGEETFDTSCVIKKNSMTIVENGDTAVFQKVTE